MELRVLKYFLAVAREESITAAADSLHITQPTLSKQLMDLENDLGKKLFIRGNRRITLTEEGKYLRQRAQEIVDLAEKTEAEFKTENLVGGDICIGGGETHAMRYMAKALESMQQKCPGIRVHLFSGTADDITERLDKGCIDFGLFVGSVDLTKYDYLKLPASDTWGLILRKDHPLAAKESITPEDLKNVPLLCSRQAMQQNELSGWLGFPTESLNLIGTYNLIYNASILVEEGIGCAVSIDGLINTSCNSQLCFRPFEPRITAEVLIAWKKYQVFSKASEKFLCALQNILNDERND